MIKLKDLLKQIGEGFSTGKSGDKKSTKNRSEKVGYKMVGEDEKPTFDLSSESERGDGEFLSGNLKSINLDEWTEKDEANSNIKRWSKPYGDKYTEYEKKKFGLKEIDVPIKIGDTIKMGRFKNKVVKIKSIEWNEKGDLMINGKSSLKFRVVNNKVGEGVSTSHKRGKDSGEYRTYDSEEDSDIREPYKPQKKLKKNKNIQEARLKSRKKKKIKIKRPSQITRLMRQSRRYYLTKGKAEKELAKSDIPGVVVSKKMGRMRMFFVSYKKPTNFWGTGRILNKESGTIKLRDLIPEDVPETIKFKDKDGDEHEIAFDTALEYGNRSVGGYAPGEHPAYKAAMKLKPEKEKKPEDPTGDKKSKQQPDDKRKKVVGDTGGNRDYDVDAGVAKTLFKRYDVNPKLEFVDKLDDDDFAHYNVDTDTIQISKFKNGTDKEFLTSILHEIDHVRDAKKYGKEKYKEEYAIEGEKAIQKGGEFRKDNRFEIKAEKWGRKEYEKVKDIVSFDMSNGESAVDIPGTSENVFGVKRGNEQFVFDNKESVPEGIPNDVNWTGMDGEDRIEYLKSVTDSKMSSGLPAEMSVRSWISDSGISKIFNNKDMNRNELVKLTGIAKIGDVNIHNVPIDIDVDVVRYKKYTKFEIRTDGYMSGDNNYFEFDRNIFVYNNGEITIENQSIHLDNFPNGTGSSILLDQIKNAKKNGVSRIICYAGGKPTDNMNGYYTWPRLGFEAVSRKEFNDVINSSINRYKRSISRKEADKAAKKYGHDSPYANPDKVHIDMADSIKIPSFVTNVKNFRELMSSDSGRNWWKKYGTSFDAAINLKDKSQVYNVIKTANDIINKNKDKSNVK